MRDIEHHLVSTIGTEISRETISKITDEVMAWQRRPPESFYPVIYLDAIVVKVRDGAHVRNKAAHIAVGVDMEGIKHVLGIWVQATEGAKFWAGVCAELANRGFADVISPGVSGEFFRWEGWARGIEVIEAVSRRAEGAGGADGGRSAR